MKNLQTSKGLSNNIKRRLNKFLDDIFSKKFFCLLLGTVLLVKHFLTGEHWIILAGVYISSNIAEKILNRNGNGNPQPPINTGE